MNRKTTARAGWRWSICLAWAALIWILLTSDSGTGRPPPAWLVAFADSGGDKLVHGLMFFVQSFLAAGAIATSSWTDRRALGWTALTAALLATVYGAGTEWAQAIGGSRHGEVGDGLANAFGAGLAAYAWWRRGR